jgi:hypothetical protein
MAEKGTYLDPQAGLVWENYLLNKGRFVGTPGYATSLDGFAMEQLIPIYREFMQRALRIPGLKIVFGTDALAGSHGRNAEEFIDRVRDVGVDPMSAMVSANSLGAEALGMAGQIGSIAPGIQGDIIALDGDPLKDIMAVRRVVFVMKGGIIYKNVARGYQSLSEGVNGGIPFGDGLKEALFPVEYRLPETLHSIVQGKRVAIVNDVVGAGSAVRGSFASLHAVGAHVVAIAALLVVGTCRALRRSDDHDSGAGGLGKGGQFQTVTKRTCDSNEERCSEFRSIAFVVLDDGELQGDGRTCESIFRLEPAQQPTGIYKPPPVLHWNSLHRLPRATLVLEHSRPPVQLRPWAASSDCRWLRS